MNSEVKAGHDKIASFSSALKGGDISSLKNEVYLSLDVNDQTTDPIKTEEIRKAGVKISFLSNKLKNSTSEPKLVNEHFGKTSDSKYLLVTDDFEITLDGVEIKYSLGSRKQDDKWVIDTNSLKLTTSNSTINSQLQQYAE